MTPRSEFQINSDPNAERLLAAKLAGTCCASFSEAAPGPRPENSATIGMHNDGPMA